MSEILVKDMKLYELYYILCVYLLLDEEIVPYDIDEVWQEVNKHYAIEEGHSLDLNEEIALRALFQFAKEKSRYKLLDELMVHLYSRFINKEEFVDSRDLFFLGNIEEMKTIMDYENKYIIKNMDDIDCDIPKINKDEVIVHVRNVLREIDPSMEWLNIYNQVLDSNHIIYLDQLTEVEKNVVTKKLGIKSIDDMSNACFFPEDKDCYIMLTYKGDISDISTTVHEIVHYICRIKNNYKREKVTLREMPSIFFELYTLNYLSKLGYDEKTLKAINNSRFADTKESLNDILGMTDYLIMLIKNGEITSDGRDRTCDNCVYDLIVNPYVYFKSYPYVIGNYLAISGMEKLKYDKKMIARIKYVTEKASTIDPYDVFKIVGYRDMNDLSRTKNKRKVRKK